MGMPRDLDRLGDQLQHAATEQVHRRDRLRRLTRRASGATTAAIGVIAVLPGTLAPSASAPVKQDRPQTATQLDSFERLCDRLRRVSHQRGRCEAAVVASHHDATTPRTPSTVVLLAAPPRPGLVRRGTVPAPTR
jgi:hypothetical protein